MYEEDSWSDFLQHVKISKPLLTVHDCVRLQWCVMTLPWWGIKWSFQQRITDPLKGSSHYAQPQSDVCWTQASLQLFLRIVLSFVLLQILVFNTSILWIWPTVSETCTPSVVKYPSMFVKYLSMFVKYLSMFIIAYKLRCALLTSLWQVWCVLHDFWSSRVDLYIQTKIQIF